MKAIFEKSLKKILENPGNTVLITGFSIYNNINPSNIINASKNIYTVWEDNKRELNLYLNTADIENLSTSPTTNRKYDYKTCNKVAIFYKLEGLPEDFEEYFLIENEDDSLIRLDTINNLIKISFPEDFNIKARFSCLTNSTEVKYLESAGTDIVRNLIYLNNVSFESISSVSKESYIKYVNSERSSLPHEFTWLDESGKIQTESYTFRIYESDSFESGVSDLSNAKLRTKYHLFRYKDGSIKVHGVVNYSEYIVSKGVISTEPRKGTVEITGLDGIEIICDKFSPNFQYSIDNINYSINYKECSSRCLSTDNPYGIFHLRLSYFNEFTGKVVTIDSNKFKLLQTGDVEMFNPKHNTDYKEKNIPLYLLNYLKGSTVEFEIDLFLEEGEEVDDVYCVNLYEDDTYSGIGDIIPGKYREYLDSIFECTYKVSRISELEAKIKVTLKTLTTNNSRTHWLPYIEDRINDPIMSTFRVYANGSIYSTKFYMVQKANSLKVNFYDSSKFTNRLLLKDKETSINCALSLKKEGDILSEDISVEDLRWKLVNSYSYETELVDDVYTVVTDDYGNPVKIDPLFQLSDKSGEINYIIPDYIDVTLDTSEIIKRERIWPDEYKTFTVTSDKMSTNLSNINLGMMEFICVTTDTSNKIDSGEIKLDSWRVDALSSRLDIQVSRIGQDPFLKLFNKEGNEYSENEYLEVTNVNSYLINVKSNKGFKVSWKYNSEDPDLEKLINYNYIDCSDDDKKRDYYTNIELGGKNSKFKKQAYERVIEFYGNPESNYSEDLVEYTPKNFSPEDGVDVYVNLRFVHDFENKKDLSNYKLGTLIFSDIDLDDVVFKTLDIYQKVNFECNRHSIAVVNNNPIFTYYSDKSDWNFITNGGTGMYHIYADKEVNIKTDQYYNSIPYRKTKTKYSDGSNSGDYAKGFLETTFDNVDSNRTPKDPINGYPRDKSYERVSPKFGIYNGKIEYLYHEFPIHYRSETGKGIYLRDKLDRVAILEFQIDNNLTPSRYNIFNFPDNNPQNTRAFEVEQYDNRPGPYYKENYKIQDWSSSEEPNTTMPANARKVANRHGGRETVTTNNAKYYTEFGFKKEMPYYYPYNLLSDDRSKAIHFNTYRTGGDNMRLGRDFVNHKNGISFEFSDGKSESYFPNDKESNFFNVEPWKDTDNGIIEFNGHKIDSGRAKTIYGDWEKLDGRQGEGRHDNEFSIRCIYDDSYAIYPDGYYLKVNISNLDNNLFEKHPFMICNIQMFGTLGEDYDICRNNFINLFEGKENTDYNGTKLKSAREIVSDYCDDCDLISSLSGEYYRGWYGVLNLTYEQFHQMTLKITQSVGDYYYYLSQSDYNNYGTDVPAIIPGGSKTEERVLTLNEGLIPLNKKCILNDEEQVKENTDGFSWFWKNDKNKLIFTKTFESKKLPTDSTTLNYFSKYISKSTDYFAGYADVINPINWIFGDPLYSGENNINEKPTTDKNLAGPLFRQMGIGNALYYQQKFAKNPLYLNSVSNEVVDTIVIGEHSDSTNEIKREVTLESLSTKLTFNLAEVLLGTSDEKFLEILRKRKEDGVSLREIKENGRATITPNIGSDYAFPYDICIVDDSYQRNEITIKFKSSWKIFPGTPGVLNYTFGDREFKNTYGVLFYLRKGDILNFQISDDNFGKIEGYNSWIFYYIKDNKTWTVDYLMDSVNKGLEALAFGLSIKNAYDNLTNTVIKYSPDIKIIRKDNLPGVIIKDLKNTNYQITFPKNETNEDILYKFQINLSDEGIDKNLHVQRINSSFNLNVTLKKYEPSFRIIDLDSSIDQDNYNFNFYADGTSLDFSNNTFRFESNNPYLLSKDLFEIIDTGKLVKNWSLSLESSDPENNSYIYRVIMLNNNGFNKSTITEGAVNFIYKANEKRSNVFSLKYHQGYCSLFLKTLDTNEKYIGVAEFEGSNPKYYSGIIYEEFSTLNSLETSKGEKIFEKSSYLVNGEYDSRSEYYEIISNDYSMIEEELVYKFNKWNLGDYENLIGEHFVNLIKEENTSDYDQYCIQDTANKKTSDLVSYSVTATLKFVGSIIFTYNEFARNYRNDIVLTLTRKYKNI